MLETQWRCDLPLGVSDNKRGDFLLSRISALENNFRPLPKCEYESRQASKPIDLIWRVQSLYSWVHRHTIEK